MATPTSTVSVYYFSICTLHKYVYCLWPLPHLLFVCTTLVQFVCNTLVLFMCTTLVQFMCTTLVLFLCTTLVLFLCTTLVLFLCSTLVLFVCSTLVPFLCSTLVLFVCSTSVLFVCSTLIRVLYNSVSVYYFYYYTLKLYLPPTGGKESPWTTASHWRLEQIFSQCSFHTSLHLPLWLALREGHVYCLWPPHYE